MLNILSCEKMSIPHKIVIDTGIDIGYSLGECVKELIEISYQIYNLILRQLFHETIEERRRIFFLD